MARNDKAPIRAEEVEVAQSSSFRLPDTERGEVRALESGRIEVVEGTRALEGVLKDKAAALAFMEEDVIIRIAEKTNENDMEPIEAGNNGKMICLWRGIDYIIKRKYLESLTRAKFTRISQKLVTNEDGARSYVYSRKTTLQHPVQLVEDRNPLGRDWWRKTLQEA